MSYKDYYLKVGIPKDDFAVIYRQVLTSFKSYQRTGRRQHTFEDLLHSCIAQYLFIKNRLNNDKTKLGYIKATMATSLAMLFHAEKKNEDAKHALRYEKRFQKTSIQANKTASKLPQLKSYGRIFYANKNEKDDNILNCITLHGLDCLRENGIGSVYGTYE